MELIWKIVLLCILERCLGDFFSDLDKLDIDSQLREIDDMLETLDDDSDDLLDSVSDTLDGLAGGPCKFKCKKGSKPVPRKGHTPKSNGCGSFGLQIDTSGLPQMTSCCNAHDICYDTCNSNRDKCDDDFKKCLDVMCEKLKREITRNQYEGCKETAKLMYGGTTALGCSPFISSQKKACECLGEETGSKTSTKTERTKQTQDNKKTEKDKVNQSETIKQKTEQAQKNKNKSKEKEQSRKDHREVKENKNRKEFRKDKSRLNDEL